MCLTSELEMECMVPCSRKKEEEEEETPSTAEEEKIKGNETGEGTDENYLCVVPHSFLMQPSLMTQCTCTWLFEDL